MIDLPPQLLRLHWCPTCGRFEITRQQWHVRAGSISDRCEGLMTTVEYECAVDRDYLRGLTS